MLTALFFPFERMVAIFPVVKLRDLGPASDQRLTQVCPLEFSHWSALTPVLSCIPGGEKGETRIGT